MCITLSASPFSAYHVNFNFTQKYSTEVYEENNFVYYKMWYMNNVKIFHHWLDSVTITVVYLNYSRTYFVMHFFITLITNTIKFISCFFYMLYENSWF